nr:unnamed protein product [uncultured bacterium]
MLQAKAPTAMLQNAYFVSGAIVHSTGADLSNCFEKGDFYAVVNNFEKAVETVENPKSNYTK